MSNLFVLDTNSLETNEFQSLKKLDKSDNLILLVSSTGMISYQIIPFLFNLKNVPEIYPYSDVNPLNLSFFFGTQSHLFNNGKCYLVTKRTDLQDFNNFKSEQQIMVLSSLDAALNDKKESKTARNKKDNSSSLEESELESNIATAENTVSDDFIILLKRYSTTALDLLEYKEIIAECVADSSEGVLSSFELLLQIKLGEELGNKVFALLEEHLEQLQTALQ